MPDILGPQGMTTLPIGGLPHPGWGVFIDISRGRSSLVGGWWDVYVSGFLWFLSFLFM
jgi:hypothetical protein